MARLAPELLERSHYRYWISDQVRFADLDALGHVNNLAVGVYFENVRVALYTQLFPDWPRLKQVFVLAHLEIDYLHELHYPAALDVGLRLQGFGETSMRMVAAVFRQNTPAAISQSVSVYIDDTTRRPVPIPPDLKQKVTDAA